MLKVSDILLNIKSNHLVNLIIITLVILFFFQELDLVKEKLFTHFSAGFEKKGYVLLGFAEAGFVYFFSKKNIADEKIIKKIKMWVWKGDRVAETFLSTFGIKYVPLHLTDVNTGLETGMLDSFYAPPLGSGCLSMVCQNKVYARFSNGEFNRCLADE